METLWGWFSFLNGTGFLDFGSIPGADSVAAPSLRQPPPMSVTFPLRDLASLPCPEIQHENPPGLGRPRSHLHAAVGRRNRSRRWSDLLVRLVRQRPQQGESRAPLVLGVPPELGRGVSLSLERAPRLAWRARRPRPVRQGLRGCRGRHPLGPGEVCPPPTLLPRAALAGAIIMPSAMSPHPAGHLTRFHPRVMGVSGTVVQPRGPGVWKRWAGAEEGTPDPGSSRGGASRWGRRRVDSCGPEKGARVPLLLACGLRAPGSASPGDSDSRAAQVAGKVESARPARTTPVCL